MSRGRSGRIVLEIDPQVKDDLYIALAKEKLTVKDWFLNQSMAYIRDSQQPFLIAEESSAEQHKGKRAK
jgi:hypothetical protein